jgi:hypothetical protein
MSRLDTLRRTVRDERSGRVVLVSHCVLNQNVRNLGGATRPGAVDEVVATLQRRRVGIVQLPCPEQRAWGGVCKRYTLPAYGAENTPLRLLRRPASGLFLAFTRRARRHRPLRPRPAHPAQPQRPGHRASPPRAGDVRGGAAPRAAPSGADRPLQEHHLIAKTTS